MRIIVSFISLFLSVVLLQLSSGGIAPLDALSGSALGFSTREIGLLGSSHFIGFFIGSWWAPRLMGAIGHNRAFATFTATGAIGILGHTLSDSNLVWAMLRVLTGMCIAGCYTVIEAWLNAKVTNDIRGRVFGVYRIVDLSASTLAQLVIGILPPAAYTSYNILAIICCAALLPLTLSRAPSPKSPKLPRLRPMRTYRISPLASVGVFVAGVTTAAFRMVGPVYAEVAGFTRQQIAWFLALTVLGGAVAQIPIGWLADKYPRRHVLLGLSLGSILASWMMVWSTGGGTAAIYTTSFLFGFMTFPIFSVSSALANDFASPDDMVGLAAGLMFIYALGAIGSPYLVAFFMQKYGVFALFTFVSIAHLFLALFGIYRSRVRVSPEISSEYTYVPRTSFIVGKMVREDDEHHKNSD